MKGNVDFVACGVADCLCGGVRHNAAPSKRVKDEIQKKVKARPCMDCGKRWPKEAMEFDHRHKKSKKNDVSRLVKYRCWVDADGQERRCTMQEFLDEIAKCDVVCACCHACRTYRQVNPYLLKKENHDR